MDSRLVRLRDAARLLVKKRWTRGYFVINRSTGQVWAPSGERGHNVASLRSWLKNNPIEKCEVCAVGAIFVAAALDPEATDNDCGVLRVQVNQRLWEEESLTGLMGYNDDPGRNRGEIVRLFQP